MVETITPDVCGSRRRQAGALLFFALGALAASACVGAILGLAGSYIGAWALPVAALFALVGAAREGGFARVPLPQSRRQVPEPWRFRLPLPAWAAGYGAGLGLGFLTYQPVATFWVACAAAVALGRPLAGALCFVAYGAGRSLLLGSTAPAGLGRHGHRRGARRPSTRRPPRECGRVACLCSAPDGTGSRCRAHPARARKPVRSVRDRARIRVHAA